MGLCLVVLRSCRVQSPQSYHNTQFRKEAVSISPIEAWSGSYFCLVKRPLFIHRNWNFVCVQLAQWTCKRGPFSPQPVIKWGMPIRTRDLIRPPTSRYTTAWPTDEQIMRLVVVFGMRSPISFAAMCEASFGGIFVRKGLKWDLWYRNLLWGWWWLDCVVKQRITQLSVKREGL